MVKNATALDRLVNQVMVIEDLSAQAAGEIAYGKRERPILWDRSDTLTLLFFVAH